MEEEQSGGGTGAEMLEKPTSRTNRRRAGHHFRRPTFGIYHFVCLGPYTALLFGSLQGWGCFFRLRFLTSFLLFVYTYICNSSYCFCQEMNQDSAGKRNMHQFCLRNLEDLPTLFRCMCQSMVHICERNILVKDLFKFILDLSL